MSGQSGNVTIEKQAFDLIDSQIIEFIQLYGC